MQESDDDDSSLEIDNEVDNSDDDDDTAAYDFNHPDQVSLCASLIVDYLQVMVPQEKCTSYLRRN